MESKKANCGQVAVKAGAVSLGTIAALHYVVAGYGDPKPVDDLLQPPPLASVLTSATSSLGMSLVVVDAVTDDEHTVIHPESDRTDEV
jgi:hypothetical protein